MWQALVTGGMPTFIDMNDVNFQSSALKEDNLIAQFKAAGKKMGTFDDDGDNEFSMSTITIFFDFDYCLRLR